MSSKQIFRLLESCVEVEHPFEVGGSSPFQAVGNTISHISYETFYRLLLAEQVEAETSIHQIHLDFLTFLNAAKVNIPEEVIRFTKTSQGWIITCLIGGEKKVFPSLNLDTSNIRVDYLIDNDRVLVKNSVQAYRYSGITGVRTLQDDRCRPLAALTSTLQSAIGRDKNVTSSNALNIHAHIRVTQRTANYARIIAPNLENTGAIGWEDYEQ